MSIVEKIKDIEKEIARTQINKATMSHLCQLRARLAKLRTTLLEPPKGASAAGDGFDVEKVGDARVALIGFPSVGKSTILNTFTTTKSEAAGAHTAGGTGVCSTSCPQSPPPPACAARDSYQP
eukprot:6205816-Pleurochrysis_carterae.AAC.2